MKGICVVYKRYVKRLLDIFLSALGMIILSPVFVIVAILVKLDSPGPLLFKQKRVGKDKSHFSMYKFRSMRADAPGNVPTHKLLTPDQYITRVGRILRKTSLDELPQLWNILVGDMSVVGPRPALWNQDDLIAERDKYGANDIRPGLTGWAQINGRDELEISVKAKLDGEYIKRMSFLFDFRCVLGTITSIVQHKGVLEGGTGSRHQGGKQGNTDQ